MTVKGGCGCSSLLQSMSASPEAALITGPTRSNSVPKGMLPVYERIVGLTDDVCGKRLNSEYRDMARAMAGALCRKRPSPLTSGQPRTWAGGIVYVLGRINFLGDDRFLRT